MAEPKCLHHHRSILTLHRWLGLTLLTITCLLTNPTWAASKLAIGQDVFEKMQEAQVQIEADNFAQAAAILDELFGKKRLNNYEKAQIHSMKGNLAYQQEKYNDAIDQFKLAAGYGNLPEGFLQVTLRTVAQLSFMQDRLDEALLYAQKMMATIAVPDAFSHMLLAQIYYKKEELQPALDNMLKAIALERGQGQNPAENWLLVLNAIYYGRGDYDKMVDVFKELISLYPKPTYLTNLAAIYGQLEQTDKQYLLLEPLYDQGKLVSESELLNLANLMILHKVPYKAAKVIEQGFREGRVKRSKRNLELLAQSWLLAAEDGRSVAYLAEAAEMSQDGVAYMRLAQTYIGLYRWPEAEKALEASLKLGKLEDKQGDAWLLLGMVRFYSKDYRAARKAFREAANYHSTAKLANQWVVFMEQERAKAEAAVN